MHPQHELYPSPAAYAAVPEAAALLEFLGAMLGKALWEGILVELPLARESITFNVHCDCGACI
jgi:ubiquitin-protein ligase E3 C